MAIESYFEDIADAIRERGGTSATLTPAAMPQAILDIPGGGGGGAVKVAEWDFSVSGTDKINGLTVTSNAGRTDGTGYLFNDQTDYIYLPKTARNSACTYEIDMGTMNIQVSSSHQRFFMFKPNSGLIYRNNGYWSFYNNSEWATDSTISSFDYFANSKIGIYIDITNKWHIYKDGILVYEPNKSNVLQDFSEYMAIGSNIGQSAYNMIIRGLKIYEGNPYA